MPWIAAGAMAVGVGTSIYGAIAGGNAQKEQQQAQIRMDNLKAARERTMQIRNARAARAQIMQRGANQGAAGSSGVAGGAADVMGQAYGNIQYLGFEQQTGEAIAKARQKEINAAGVGDIGKGITEMAGTVFSNYENIGKIFDSGGTP